LEKRTCPFLLENYAQGGGTGIFQFHVLLDIFIVPTCSILDIFTIEKTLAKQSYVDIFGTFL